MIVGSMHVIDSHTAGEPTRVVASSNIELAGQTMSEKRDDFKARLDHVRSGLVCEPRGSDVLVGALLTPPVNEDSTAGVVFFNNVGYLGMCGHGTIGVVETLRFLNRIPASTIDTGVVRLDTPVGTVEAAFGPDGEIFVRNVPSYRFLANVTFEAPGVGLVVGDVAYGGNWFFIVREPLFQVDMTQLASLTSACVGIKAQLEKIALVGDGGEEIDHIEIMGPPSALGAHSRNFVLCPGSAYDRSPCGTGTSANMACLVEAGLLQPGEKFIQESVTGSTFVGWMEQTDLGLVPHIQGRAFVTADSLLFFDPEDPLRWGI